MRALFKEKQSSHDACRHQEKKTKRSILGQTRKHARTDKKACLGRLRSSFVYLTAGTVSISGQIEAAVKACEAETARITTPPCLHPALQLQRALLLGKTLPLLRGTCKRGARCPCRGSPRQMLQNARVTTELDRLAGTRRLLTHGDWHAVSACAKSLRGWLSMPQLQTCIAFAMCVAACSQTCHLALYT